MTKNAYAVTKDGYGAIKCLYSPTKNGYGATKCLYSAPKFHYSATEKAFSAPLQPLYFLIITLNTTKRYSPLNFYKPFIQAIGFSKNVPSFFCGLPFVLRPFLTYCAKRAVNALTTEGYEACTFLVSPISFLRLYS